tara:strand:- start:38479 stop:38754 length:276 start_codon:yes stop_codon:yes gene_type:complete
MDNINLKENVKPDTDLKNILVEYVGEKLNPENQLISVEMIIDVLADEFPEFVLALAEENWIRGYQQGLDDIQSGQRLVENEKRKTCKLCEG